MNSWLNKWRNKPPFERTMIAVSTICSAAMVALCLMYLFNLITGELIWVVPLMGLTMVAHAGLNWKKDRAISIFALFGAAFLFYITVRTFM